MKIVGMQYESLFLNRYKTINKYISRVSGLFNWAVDHGYVQKNYFAKLQIKDRRKKKDARKPFLDSELRLIFGSKEYKHNSFKYNYQYWIPLIALHTGARIEEICSLLKKDIKREGEYWLIDINEEGEKDVKTDSSIRVVPIHPSLISIGFIDFVNSSNEGRIFPELSPDKFGKYSSVASKWFRRYRNKLGIVDKQKVFHSFRHTLINSLKQSVVSKDIIAALAGHEDGSVTFGVYTEEYGLDILYDALCKVNFDDALKDVAPWKK